MMSKKVKVLAIQFMNFCFLSLFITFSQAEVTLTVGKGSALPNATESPVAVSLENQVDLVRGMQLDVCDVDDYLECTGCDTTTRADGFSCITIEKDNGCCGVILANFGGGLIEAGQGSIFTINYDVASGAPSGCRELTTENVSVADEYNQPLVVTTEPGGFCFPCISHADCNDGLFCNGDETCVGGTCQPGTDQCTTGQVCDERADVCIAACVDDQDCADTNSCTTDSCDLDSGYCQNDPLPDGTACEDGVYCNGVETCDAGGICQPDTNPCPGQMCDEINDECVDCLDNTNCPDDGAFCNGDEICDNGSCTSSGDPCPGQSCNEATDSCETIITSTTTSTSPPPPPPPATSTTTTAISHSYKVTIIPSSATLDSGATFQFSAKTTDGGEEIEGNYGWEIYPASTIGSEIDGEGLFTAGDNTTDAEISETIKVTDTDHENKSATAVVTVKVKKDPPPECEVVINPSSATVPSQGTLTLEAETTGDGCETGNYEWTIEGEIGSMIDQEGNYNAGINNTGSHTTDVITVVDHANADISDSASIIVESKIASVFPNTLLGSRWIPLPYFLLVMGEDTKLKISSTITFEPDDDILKIAQLKLGNSFLVIMLVKADPQEGTVVVTISSGEEIVTGEVSIKLLSLPFAEDYSSSVESYSEISLDAATLSDEHSVERNSL